ncbi:MAG: leucine-rich repeat protein [Ruminococcus sp.]|nr:leucine-rich repeat protein [Ruminococcus sp.]
MKKTTALTFALVMALSMGSTLPAAADTDIIDPAETDQVVTDEMDIIEAAANADKKSDAADYSAVKDWNGFKYKVRKDGVSVMIVGYQGKESSVTFPSKLEGKPVTIVQGDVQIGFSSTLKEVTFQNGIKKINWPLFNNTQNLEKVYIPGSVELIASNTFSNCTNLKEVTIEQGVGRIDTAAFKNTAIKEISIPGGTSIASDAFKECKNLEKVVLHEGTTSIGESAFSYCPKLKEVYIPNSVKTIPKNISGVLMYDPFWMGKTQKYPENLVIYGYPGSAAEKYAKDTKRNITFKLHPDLAGKGDVNEDGNVDVTDIAMIASHIKGIKALSEQGKKNADVNNSATIDVSDIALIASHIKGIKALV